MNNPSSKKSQGQDLQNEKEWHKQVFYVDSGHWSSHPLFASRQRHWLCNDMQRIRFYSGLYEYIKKKPYRGKAQVLLAPAGNGRDMFYLQGIYKQVYGIDISAVSLAECPKPVITKEADILDSGYADQSFDIIICSQFLHHVQGIGFEPFLKEFLRLLKKGGTLAILEPGNLYPFGWATALARKAMGNVTGLVEEERPIPPARLTADLKKTGFSKIYFKGMVFTHVRFPSFLQHLLDALDYPFRVIFPFKLFANFIGWYCVKPE